MPGEIEYAVVVGDGRYFQADALETFFGSAENGVSSRARTKRYALYGPAGAAVTKRIHIAVTHQHGCAFWATPVVDGELHSENRRFFSAAPSTTGKPIADSFILPCSVDRGAYRTGLRGTSFGVEIEREVADRRFEVESVTFEAIPLDAARGKGISE